MKEGVWYHPEYDVVCRENAGNETFEFKPDVFGDFCTDPIIWMMLNTQPSLEAKGWIRIGDFD